MARWWRSPGHDPAERVNTLARHSLLVPCGQISDAFQHCVESVIILHGDSALSKYYSVMIWGLVDLAIPFSVGRSIIFSKTFNDGKAGENITKSSFGLRTAVFHKLNWVFSFKDFLSQIDKHSSCM